MHIEAIGALHTATSDTDKARVKKYAQMARHSGLRHINDLLEFADCGSTLALDERRDDQCTTWFAQGAKDGDCDVQCLDDHWPTDSCSRTSSKLMVASP